MRYGSQNGLGLAGRITDSVPVWRHTVVLTGRLDDQSAPEIEDEIECLYQEGVTSLRLDLRGLDEVDRAGVDAVGVLSARYKSQGHDLAMIAGSRALRRALAERGAIDVLDGEEADFASDRRYASGVEARSTSTIKQL